MNKKYLATLLLTVTAAWALFNNQNNTQPYSFQQFKTDYQKHYQKEGEESYRKSIFIKNMLKIAEHNANPLKTYEMGVNQFTDLSDAEFQALYLTLRVPKKDIEILNNQAPQVDPIDWKAKGAVSPVKNQGNCGSCWAFSAVAAIQSAVRLRDSTSTITYSEQQLVDCSQAYGNMGCNGGWMDSAFSYIHDKGIAQDKDYPYVAKDQTCKTIQVSKLKISGYTDVQSCDTLIRALKDRPISVAVDATSWSGYKTGILVNCGKNVNHGVLLFGVNDNYWSIKNSWGTSWGEQGFIKLAPGNTCAICNYPSYPSL